MNPILYSNTESSFANNGIGVLSDAIRCYVTEERNGAFELEMDYPITGIHYDEIALQKIILAKPNQSIQTQPFRIYRITRPMNGVVTIYAEHISYDMSGIAISPFSAGTISEAFVKLKQYAVGTCPFTFTTDKTTQATMTVTYPCSMRSQLGGKAGSILDIYGGGEYTFDRYSVALHQNRGQDNGVVIRYGKNLTDIKQEENCSKVYSAVYPYWINSETGVLKEITGKIVRVSGTFPVERILTYDLSQAFESEPTEAQMISKTESYIANNSIGIPSVNLDVSFVQLEQSDEYKGLALLERVNLCDTVRVHFPDLGVNATAKAISLKYNVLLDRVESITLGDAKTKITDSILATQEAVEQVPTTSEVTSMITTLTQALMGASGGAIRLLDTNDDGVPDTLYIADNADPAQAVKVWRFNYQGWGASSTGYQGPYTMGATLATGLVADFITAGTLNAGVVTVGGTGVTIDGTSITVLHPSVSNTARTVIDASGFKIYNGNALIGGIATLNNVVTSIIQTLYNASIPSVKINVGEHSGGVADAVEGLDVLYNGTSVLTLGAGFIEGSLMDSEIVSDRALIIYSRGNTVTIGAGNSSISIDNSGDIEFSGYKPNGTYYSFKGSDVYGLID